MRFVAHLLFRLAALSVVLAMPLASAFAADCGKGSADERIACLNDALTTLGAKVATLTQQLEQKASKGDLDAKANDADTVKWDDWIVLRNQDMRIYPRCLDNPGPDTQDLTGVAANSCASVAGQTWNIAKPR